LLGGAVTALAAHVDAKLVCIGASPNRLSLFNVETARFEIDMETAWPRPSSLAFLASKTALACGEMDGQVRIVDLATRSSVTICGPLSGAVSGLAFHPETQLLFASDGSRGLTVTDTTNWKTLGRFLQRHRVSALANGPRRGLVLVGCMDGTVTLLRRYISVQPRLSVRQ
jgi:WD40 repeat protein